MFSFQLGGLDKPKTASVIGLFRRESAASMQGFRPRTNSESSLHGLDSPGAVLVIEEGLKDSIVSRRTSTGRRGSMLELSSSVGPIPEEPTPESSPAGSRKQTDDTVIQMKQDEKDKEQDGDDDEKDRFERTQM